MTIYHNNSMLTEIKGCFTEVDLLGFYTLKKKKNISDPPTGTLAHNGFVMRSGRRVAA